MNIKQIFASINAAYGEPNRLGEGDWVARVPYHERRLSGPTTEIKSQTRNRLLSIIRARKAISAVAIVAEQEGLQIDAESPSAIALYERLAENYSKDWRKEARALIRELRAA